MLRQSIPGERQIWKQSYYMVKRNCLYIGYGSKVIIWLNVIVSTSDMEAKLLYG